MPVSPQTNQFSIIFSALQKEHKAISCLEIFRNFTYLEDDSNLTEDQLTEKNI